MIADRATTLTTTDGVALEARLVLPARPLAGLVACHPHPLYGGDMHNPVVVRVTEVCGELGFATLRFNFRGVGGSQGIHDGGRGEERDVETALLHLRDVLEPTTPLALAGYSFGAAVASQVATRSGGTGGLAGLALIAPPLALTGEEPFAALESFSAPLLIVAGGQDAYCPRPALDALARRLSGAVVTVVDGATHFFLGTLFPLGEAVRTWAQQLHAERSNGPSSAGCA
jgi:alpha/beta superfamily hydrolase